MEGKGRGLAGGEGEHGADGGVEVSGGEELFEGEVHTVAPIVVGVGGDVDPLIVGVLPAEVAVDRKPVGKRKDGEHRRRGEVVVQHLLADPRLAEIRYFRTFEHLAAIAGGKFAILLPPSPQRTHVVGRGGADGQIGIGGNIRKGLLRVLGHGLNLEGQDFQVSHHFRNTGGNHAEILAAGEHAGG